VDSLSLDVLNLCYNCTVGTLYIKQHIDTSIRNTRTQLSRHQCLSLSVYSGDVTYIHKGVGVANKVNQNVFPLNYMDGDSSLLLVPFVLPDSIIYIYCLIYWIPLPHLIRCI